MRRRKFTLRWRRACVTMIATVLSFCSLGVFVVALEMLSKGETGGAVFIMVLSIPFLIVFVWGALRAARSSSLEFSKGQIVIRELMRTRRIPLSEVREVGATRGVETFLPWAWHVPFFKLIDGSMIRAEEVGSFRTGSIVDDVVAEARRRLASDTSFPQ